MPQGALRISIHISNTPFISLDGYRDYLVFHAYDARDVSRELYNSNQAASGRDLFGPGNKFITPTIANGRVYVGTANGVAVFGSLSPRSRRRG